MSLFDGFPEGTEHPEVFSLRPELFTERPGYFAPAGLWLYGNIRLLATRLEHVDEIPGKSHFYPTELDAIEREAERIVLDGKTLVCGIHNEGHMRAAIVPLRWGSPRIVVFSGGFRHHLGDTLNEEPFRAARLWRYQWDAQTDLAVSRRAPEKKPTYAFSNPTVDRLITEIAMGNKQGLDHLSRELTPLVAR